MSTVCVVGATGGIGAALVERLRARPGQDDVLAMDLAGPALEEIGRRYGVATQAIDLRSEQDVRAAVRAGRQHHARLSGLVVCSGIVDLTAVAGTSLERWQQVLAINLTGSFLVTRESLDWIDDGGRIVLLSSLAARTGGVLTGPAYAASKAGLEGYAKALARELAPRAITVNCVSPGAIDTPMLRQSSEQRRAAMAAGTPLGRIGEAGEIAAAIAFALDRDAGFMTGAVIPVNGGIRMD